MINTRIGKPLSDKLITNYFNTLVNRIFKILPMRENEERTLAVYIDSLQSELIGCKGLIISFKDNSDFLSLLSILQYLIDNPNCHVSKVKREVFNAISICGKLKSFLTGRCGDEHSVERI